MNDKPALSIKETVSGMETFICRICHRQGCFTQSEDDPADWICKCGHSVQIELPEPVSGMAWRPGEASLIRSKLFQKFLEQGFWHAHHVDLVWRYNGEDVREEADWLKDLWYAMRGKPAAAPVTTGWRPIETAPKDGTEILITGGGYGSDDTGGEFYTDGPFKGVAVVWWTDKQWIRVGCCNDYFHPTHWMPLPPPPSEPKGDEHE